ncbi:MAG: SUMF1/EgtB/PvdO family nonheme iron enzyme, partial [Planctomycetes bacterium]|nr:SUMF1/EgtB/PvdO family nonheme iron enzyme [Planctomycetota bacterium]
MQIDGCSASCGHVVNRRSGARLSIARRIGWRLIAVAVLCTGLVAACGDGTTDAPAAPPPDLAVDLGDGVTMDFVLVRSGEFTMGEHPTDFRSSSAHQVKIAKPFYLGRYEVTQEQWQAVM